MAYKVLIGFYDIQDVRKHYRPNDIYPRKGLKPTKARVEQLAKAGYIEMPKPKAKPQAKPKDKKDSE